MAIIYGRADSEKQLLSKYPKRVQSIDEIDKVHSELKEELEHEKDGIIGGIKKWNKKDRLTNLRKTKTAYFILVQKENCKH